MWTAEKKKIKLWKNWDLVFFFRAELESRCCWGTGGYQVCSAPQVFSCLKPKKREQQRVTAHFKP